MKSGTMLVEVSVPGFEPQQSSLSYELEHDLGDLYHEKFEGEALKFDDTYVDIAFWNSVDGAQVSESKINVVLELDFEDKYFDWEMRYRVSQTEEIPSIFEWDEVEVKVKVPRLPTFINQPKVEEAEITIKVRKLSTDLVETASE